MTPCVFKKYCHHNKKYLRKYLKVFFYLFEYNNDYVWYWFGIETPATVLFLLRYRIQTQVSIFSNPASLHLFSVLFAVIANRIQVSVSSMQ